MQWLQYGEGPRFNETPPHPITGRYKLQDNIRHNTQLETYARAAPLTGNTMSRAGMDPLTLANTRTQFSFTNHDQDSGE